MGTRSGLTLAALSLAIVMAVRGDVLTHFERDGELTGPTVVKLQQIDAPDAKLPVLHESDAITVRGAVQEKDRQFDTSLEVSAAGHHFRVPVSEWTNIGCHGSPDLTIDVSPFGAAGVAITRHESTCGAHVNVDSESMLFIDGRHPESATEVVFENSLTSGYANAAALNIADATTCDWKDDDFICAQLRTIDADWAKLPSARRFSILQRTSLPVVSDVARRFRSFADLAAVRRPPEEDILVDNVGVLIPIMPVGSNGEVFAAIDQPDSLTATFYLLADRRIVATSPIGILDLAQGKAPFSDAPSVSRDPMPFTRLFRDVKFTPAVLRKRGNAGLYSIVMDTGKGRSLFWIAIDPGHPESFAALRVASTAGDGQEKYRVVPPSLLSYQFNKLGTATIAVANKWYDDYFGQGATCCVGEDEKTTPAVFDGTLAWTPLGFEASLHPRQEPTSRVAVTISPDGMLGSRPLDDDSPDSRKE